MTAEDLPGTTPTGGVTVPLEQLEQATLAVLAADLGAGVMLPVSRGSGCYPL